MRPLLALALLGCVAGRPVDPDAYVADAGLVLDAPLSDRASSEPICDPDPRCEDGSSPWCSDGSARWIRNSDGDCRIGGTAWAMSCAVGTRPCSERGTFPVCVPRDPAINCPDQPL